MATYYSNASRSDRVRPGDLPGSIAVDADPAFPLPIGIASESTPIGGWDGDGHTPPEATWRLAIGGAALDGWYALRRGVFVELGDAAE